jgi:hypothetical protein
MMALRRKMFWVGFFGMQGGDECMGSIAGNKDLPLGVAGLLYAIARQVTVLLVRWDRGIFTHAGA